jgi:hypothetical protein
VWDRKLFQVNAIAKKLGHLMPSGVEIDALQGAAEVDRKLREERLGGTGLSA